MERDVGRDMLDLSELMGPIRRAKFASMIVVLVCCALGFGASYLLKPKYQVEVLLATARQPSQTGGLNDVLGNLGAAAGFAGIMLGPEQNSTEAVALLSSRKLTARFIAKNELMPILFFDEWDSQLNDWNVSRPSKIPSVADALELFAEEIMTVEVDQRTGLITLSIRWHDAQQAADWAGGLVRLLNSDMRDQIIDEASRSLEFLNNEVGATSMLGVKQAIYSLVEQEIGRIMVANVKEEYALRIIDPAVVPDADEYIWPNRVMFGILGAFGGIGLVLLLAYRRMDRPLVVTA